MTFETFTDLVRDALEERCIVGAVRKPAFSGVAPFLKECPDWERLVEAMREVNKAVMDLYMLWVEPYL